METIDASTGEILPEKTPEPAQGALSPTAAPWSGARRPHARVLKLPRGTSLSKQSFAAECDINKIIKKFEKNGITPPINPNTPQFGNFINFQDYHTSMNKILEAQDAFAAIPSEIRKTFQNDPAVFLEFAQNPENLDQMIELGLADPRDRNKEQLGDNPEKPENPPGKPENPGKPPVKPEQAPTEGG